jgi:hypothetical protein
MFFFKGKQKLFFKGKQMRAKRAKKFKNNGSVKENCQKCGFFNIFTKKVSRAVQGEKCGEYRINAVR